MYEVITMNIFSMETMNKAVVSLTEIYAID